MKLIQTITITMLICFFNYQVLMAQSKENIETKKEAYLKGLRLVPMEEFLVGNKLSIDDKKTTVYDIHGNRICKSSKNMD